MHRVKAASWSFRVKQVAKLHPSLFQTSENKTKTLSCQRGGQEGSVSPQKSEGLCLDTRLLRCTDACCALREEKTEEAAASESCPLTRRPRTKNTSASGSEAMNK